MSTVIDAIEQQAKRLMNTKDFVRKRIPEKFQQEWSILSNEIFVLSMKMRKFKKELEKFSGVD